MSFKQDVSSYLQSSVGSVDTFIRYYNIWAQNRHVPSDLLLLRYEELKEDPARELCRVLDFLNIKDVSDDTIRQAVEFSSFDNMQKMEVENAFRSNRLRPGDVSDPESFKVRKGKVGGYSDYLTAEDIDYLNRKIAIELSPFYGYK